MGAARKAPKQRGRSAVDRQSHNLEAEGSTPSPATSVSIRCSHSELLPLEKLVPNPKNPNRHPEAQLRLLAKIIQAQGFRSPIVVSRRSGFIIKGHGRLEAARALGMEAVPVDFQDYASEAEEYADLIADNRLAELAEMDQGALKDLLQELDTGELDMELTGFDEAALAELMTAVGAGGMGDGEAREKLQERFIIPPFSILDSRAGYWQERKRAWRALIKDGGESRTGLLKFSKLITSKFGSQGAANVSLLDPVLAELACAWFTPSGEKAAIFDSFAGDTVFGFVAAYLGHDFTGIELRQEQAELNEARCHAAGLLNATYINDDARNLGKRLKPESQDLFFSCPPYLDLEKYSDDPRDLSAMSHEAAFAVFQDVFRQAFQALRPNRFAVLVIGEVRTKRGPFAAFVPKLIQAMQEAGFAYYNEAILVNCIGTAALRADKAMNNSRKLTKVHQNVLVFFKGDPKAIPATFGPFLNAEDIAEELQAFAADDEAPQEPGEEEASE